MMFKLDDIISTVHVCIIMQKLIVHIQQNGGFSACYGVENLI